MVGGQRSPELRKRGYAVTRERIGAGEFVYRISGTPADIKPFLAAFVCPLSRSFPPFRKRSLSALLRHCFGTLTLPISPGPDIETEGLPLPARAPGPDQISRAGRGLWRDDCDGSRRRREGR